MAYFMKKNHEGEKYGSTTFGMSAAAVIGVIFLILSGVGAHLTSFNPVLLTAILAVIYVAVCCVMIVILRRKHEKVSGDTVIKSVLSGVLRDTVQWMQYPVLICDESDASIIWNNKSAASFGREEEKNVLGMRFDKYAGIAMGEVMLDESELGAQTKIAIALYVFADTESV